MRIRIVTLAATALAGCSESHGRVPGVDGTTPVIELTADDWANFCIWREGLRGEEQLRYECDAEGNVLPGECDRTDCYTWHRGECISGIRSFDDVFPPTRASCTATTEQWAACWESLVEHPCYVIMTTASPECVAFWDACPPTIPPDAGREDGG